MLVLRELRRLLSCSTHNSRAAPFFGRRLLCAGAVEQAEDEEGCNEEGGVLSKKALMQEGGFTEPQIEAVLNTHPRSDKLALLLTILKDRGIVGPTAGAFVSSHTNFLHGDLKQFSLRLQNLEDVGLSSTLLKKVILQRANLLSAFCSVERVQNHLSFLKDIGFSEEESFMTMLRCPGIFRLCIEKRLKPRSKLLYEKGFSKDALRKLGRSHPYIFTSSDAYLQRKLEFIEGLGLDMKTGNGIHALRMWGRYSVETLSARIAFLKTLGYSHQEVTLMVQRLPSILSLTEELLKKKIEFLKDDMKLSFEYMLSSSTIFTCSLEKRVIPRWAILQDLKVKGLLEKPVSFVSVCAASNADFAKKYNVDPHLLS